MARFVTMSMDVEKSVTKVQYHDIHDGTPRIQAVAVLPAHCVINAHSRDGSDRSEPFVHDRHAQQVLIGQKIGVYLAPDLSE
jgi:hypothetical protein